MKPTVAIALWLIIAESVVTMWLPARWAVSAPEICTFGLAAILLAACAAGWLKLTLSPLMVPLAGVVLWGLLQIRMGETVYEWRTKIALIYWAANGAAFFAALQAFSDARARRWFLNALLLFGFAIAIISAAQSLDPANKVFWIFEPAANAAPQFGPFPYRNQYSAFIELLLPFALFRAITEEKYGLLNGLIVAVLYTSVIAAASRMGFFLTTAEMLIVPALVMSRRHISFRRIRGTALTFLLMVVMLGVAAGPDSLLKKFETPDPYVGRREYTEASLAMVKDRPLLGFGLGTWSAVYPGYAKSDDGLFVNQAHDDWAQWAAEGGIPFAFLMLAIAVWATRRALRTAWGLGVTAVFVHCLVDYPIQRTGVALAMFCMLAAIASEPVSIRRPDRKDG